MFDACVFSAQDGEEAVTAKMPAAINISGLFIDYLRFAPRLPAEVAFEAQHSGVRREAFYLPMFWGLELETDGRHQ